jgi:hydroxylamine reductase
LIYLLKGIAFWGTRGREMGVIHEETDLFVAQALFATITNANFDPDRFVDYIREAVSTAAKPCARLPKPAASNCMAIPARAPVPIGPAGSRNPMMLMRC